MISFPSWSWAWSSLPSSSTSLFNNNSTASPPLSPRPLHLFLSIGVLQFESFQFQGIPNDVDTSMIIITIMSMIMIIIVIIITFEPRNCISASILAPPNKSVFRFQVYLHSEFLQESLIWVDTDIIDQMIIINTTITITFAQLERLSPRLHALINGNSKRTQLRSYIQRWSMINLEVAQPMFHQPTQVQNLAR